MNKQDIVRRLEKVTEKQGFITAAQFARFMGRTNVSKCKAKYLDGLDRIDGKYYFVPEVAAVLMKHRDSAS